MVLFYHNTYRVDGCRMLVTLGGGSEKRCWASTPVCGNTLRPISVSYGLSVQYLCLAPYSLMPYPPPRCGDL